MRQAGHGPSAGFLPLVILPAVWLALYGTRRQLLIVLGATALVLLLPWALIGGERYPESTVRSALLVLVVAALASLTIQRLLGEVRTTSNRLSAILETAGSLVIVTDREARIEHFNRAAEEVSGFAAAAVARPLADRGADAAGDARGGARGVGGRARRRVPARVRARVAAARRRPPARVLVGHLPGRRRGRDRSPDRHRHRRHRGAPGGRGVAHLDRPFGGRARAHDDADRGQGSRRPLPAGQPRVAGVGRARRHRPHRRGALPAGCRHARAGARRRGLEHRRGARVRARVRRLDRLGRQVPAARRGG